MRFQIFFINDFFRKKKKISKINKKHNFWRPWPFLREQDNQYNLFRRRWDTQYCFYVFSSKTRIPAEWKPKTQFSGHIFPHINGSIGPIISKNNRIHPWIELHQPCEFHESWFKTTICIMCSYTSVNICVCVRTGWPKSQFPGYFHNKRLI